MPFLQLAYTLELNLMERVWRYVKDKLSCHRWWADWEALWTAMHALLARLKACFHRENGSAQLEIKLPKLER
jgi:hypothetical protein